ncbi:CarD family transcriptional regulator [Spirochaeta dissipatitropha]
MSASQTKDQKTTFAAGQEVVYPLQGVGIINKIETREFQGKTILYYVIYLEVSDMTVMVPVDKAEPLGIRAIVDKASAEHALQLVGEASDPIPADWKMRYQMNLDLLKEGSVSDIARVVRSLYHRSKVKELPILERKLFDSALTLLVAETSSALGKTKKEMEEAIFSRLESEKPDLEDTEDMDPLDDFDDDLD